jgi:hypothetical protein
MERLAGRFEPGSPNWWSRRTGGWELGCAFRFTNDCTKRAQFPLLDNVNSVFSVFREVTAPYFVFTVPIRATRPSVSTPSVRSPSRGPGTASGKVVSSRREPLSASELPNLALRFALQGSQRVARAHHAPAFQAKRRGLTTLLEYQASWVHSSLALLIELWACTTGLAGLSGSAGR